MAVLKGPLRTFRQVNQVSWDLKVTNHRMSSPMGGHSSFVLRETVARLGQALNCGAFEGGAEFADDFEG